MVEWQVRWELADPGVLLRAACRPLAGHTLCERRQCKRAGRAILMREFWAQTLPSAVDRAFTGIESPIRASLRELEIAAARRGQK